ncbi:MAG: hypothetical protein CMA86_01620 [Euryarchaeota archaeon]|nr:hypothetical protein [Euryarchaeota archaeon]
MPANMQESKAARFSTVCTLYFAQGVPWFFVAGALVIFLVDNGSMDDDQKRALISAGMVPWIVGKLVLGPIIDRYQIPAMGRRRPWVLLSQLGMILTMAAFLLVEDPAEDLEMLGLFFLIHNIFAALQDVSSDALAVDMLADEELPLANGLMFVAKGLGAMFAMIVLLRVLSDSNFQAALMVQIAVLSLVMLVPLFILERPGDKRFPWSNDGSGENASSQDVMTFGEILAGFKGAVSNRTAKMALLLCTVMWIGGGMGTGLGVIDFQWEFLFVEDLKWDAQDFADFRAVPIFFATMLGFLIGGFLGSKFGSKRTLTYAVAVGTVMTVAWSLLRSNWTDSGFMMQIWLLWTLVWAIVGANLLAFLMSVTTKDIGGTQFSIYMTLINVGAFAGVALSPKLLDLAGGSFPNLFLAGAAFQALVFIVLTQIDDDATVSATDVVSESE